MLEENESPGATHTPQTTDDNQRLPRNPVTGQLSTEEPDFYFEGPYMVFTAAYHRKRGYCCKSGCRHCPYGFKKTRPRLQG